MKNYKRQLLALLALGSFLVTQNSVAAKTLKMAANLDSEPFIYRDQGVAKGFEVELINEIGRIKGFDVEFLPAIFPQVFQDLQSRKIDFIGHVYNDEGRKRLYSLSDPHYVENIRLLTLKDKKIDSPFTEGLVFSTLSFSPLEEEFQDFIQKDYPQLKNKSYQTSFLGFKHLFLQDVDISMLTESSINRLTGRYPEYAYQTFSLPDKYQQQVMISFLTLKENSELTEEINDGLKILKANGFYDNLRKKYHL